MQRLIRSAPPADTASMAAKVLVAEPHPAQSDALQIALAEWGYEAICVSNADQISEKCGTQPIDIVLWGLATPESPAIQSRVRRLFPNAAWIAVIEAHSQPPIEGLADGQWIDAVWRPVEPPQLALALARATRHQHISLSNERLRAQLDGAAESHPIIGASSGMIALLEEIERTAATDAAVLLLGEAGSGREGLARAIHAQSERRRGPFIRIDCEPGESGEARLFGEARHRAPRRRAPIVLAERGTLYLDHAERLSPRAQAGLEQLLETGSAEALGSDKPVQVDVRLVIATSTLLTPQDHNDVGFDSALLERFRGQTLCVPPLRERRDDLPLLIDHFFATANRERSTPLRALASEALESLTHYDWPGNLRELECVVQRAVLLADGPNLEVRDLALSLEPPDTHIHQPTSLNLRRVRRQAEIDVIRRALRQTRGNRTHAAKLLEISHRALLYKLKDFAIHD